MSETATTTLSQSRIRRTSRAARSGLDVMLSEAAAGGPPRFLVPGSGVRLGAGLVRHPRRAAARAAGLTAELARTAAGRSELAPAKGDRRFADPAWGGQLAAQAGAPELPGRR
jgi:polyhydroxyalkanoate synthase subunit PhaC